MEDRRNENDGIKKRKQISKKRKDGPEGSRDGKQKRKRRKKVTNHGKKAEGNDDVKEVKEQ